MNDVNPAVIKDLLRQSGLRATPARIATLSLMSHSSKPLSHSEVAAELEESGYNATKQLRLMGVGKIYQQTAIDTHSNVGFAKVYPDKTALTAADFMNDKVLPFFDSENMSLLRVLTDRGTEYCGRIETHPYQLFLHLNGIEHSRTKVRHPQTNGSTERLNQIIQNEFYKVAFRKKIYTSIEEIQVDLDIFMATYNNERTNQGKHCQGRTPMQTLREGRALYQQYVFENSEVSLHRLGPRLSGDIC